MSDKKTAVITILNNIPSCITNFKTHKNFSSSEYCILKSAKIKSCDLCGHVKKCKFKVNNLYVGGSCAERVIMYTILLKELKNIARMQTFVFTPRLEAILKRIFKYARCHNKSNKKIKKYYEIIATKQQIFNRTLDEDMDEDIEETDEEDGDVEDNQVNEREERDDDRSEEDS